MISSGRLPNIAVQQAADGIAGVVRQMLRAAADQARDRNDGERREEERTGALTPCRRSSSNATGTNASIQYCSQRDWLASHRPR